MPKELNYNTPLLPLAAWFGGLNMKHMNMIYCRKNAVLSWLLVSIRVSRSFSAYINNAFAFGTFDITDMLAHPPLRMPHPALFIMSPLPIGLAPKLIYMV